MYKILFSFAFTIASICCVFSQTNSALINNWTDYTDTALSIPSKTNINSWDGVSLHPNY